MAESADILTGPHQQVILPDLNAGCSMADMADLDGVEQIWDELAEVTDIESVVPITYMNSAASLKAFVGRNCGAVCTSSNARAVLTWALGLELDAPAGAALGAAARRSFSSPTSTSGATPASSSATALRTWRWSTRATASAASQDAEVKEATLLLVEGALLCPPALPRPPTSTAFRAEHPDGIVIVHPECSHEVVELADQVGSTDYIIGAVAAAPAGSTIAVGTEIHLVDRLAREHPRQDRRVPRPARVPLLDDVPHRPRPPRLGPRRPGRRRGAQPHRRRRGDAPRMPASRSSACSRSLEADVNDEPGGHRQRRSRSPIVREP